MQPPPSASDNVQTTEHTGSCIRVQVEPAGYRDSGAVHHGDHPGGAEAERRAAHQPHHHPNHEGATNSTR